MADEAYAEAIRLLYVAVTRAEQRCYLCTTAFAHYSKSPLGLTLHWQKDDDIATSLQQLVNDEPEAIGLLQTDFADVDVGIGLECAAGVAGAVVDNKIQNSAPQVATFSGKIERDWWLSSFSAINKNLRHAGVSTPDRDNHADASNTQYTDIEAANIEAAVKTQHLIRFNLSKGAHTGNLLHDILEHTNFTDPQWHEVMKWPLVRYGELNPINSQVMIQSIAADSANTVDQVRGKYNSEDLSSWLQQVLNTPLLEANCCLADIDFEHSLRESEFYFPMHSAQGDQLTDILHQHRQSSLIEQSTTHAANATNASAHTHLPHYYALKGMMHGFIDLIFESQGQYFVCDYKSNHLGEHYNHYEHQALQQNVESNNYDLQYLIYSLALHRYLQQNLADYDPDVHFGGVYYFYLRGMTDEDMICAVDPLGNEQPSRAGVFFKMISPEILQQLDQLFSGEAIEEDQCLEVLAEQGLSEQDLGEQGLGEQS